MFGIAYRFAAVGLIALVVLAVRRFSSSQQSNIRGDQSLEKCAFDKDILPILDFDLSSTTPHPYRPWKPGKFQLTMGIRKMAPEQWLILDKCYLPEQNLRQRLLQEHRPGVLQYLPGSELACEEVLDLIVDFLTKRYPKQFLQPVGKADYLTNRLTGRTFRVTKPYELHPLEIAAQLIMEDINLLVKGENDDDKHYLRASFSMAPAGWDLQERIGWPLWKIHAPVPMWSDKLLKSVERFFFNLKVSSPVERNNFFVQTTHVLFQQTPFAASLPEPPSADDIRLRYERQTFRRLPRSGAVCFMVRTFLIPMTDLVHEPESLRNLILACRALPPSMAKYKGRHVWMYTMEAYGKQMLGRDYPEIEASVEHEGKNQVLDGG